MLATHETFRPDIRAEQATGPSGEGADEISNAFNALLADLFAIYVKTKHFDWHVTGRHFRDFHLLFDAQCAQVLATIDPAAERVGKCGRATLRFAGHINRLPNTAGNEALTVTTAEMLAELASDNCRLASMLRKIHGLCERYRDVATANNIANWIDEAEGRIWFLTETPG